MDTIVSPLGLASAVLQAEEVNRRLMDPAVLRELGQRVIDFCQQAGWPHIVAASRSAESLVTAAVLGADGQLTAAVHGIDNGRVVIVESAVVTGGVLSGVAETFRLAGSSWIGAVVLERVRPDLDDLDEAGLFDFVGELAGS